MVGKVFTTEEGAVFIPKKIAGQRRKKRKALFPGAKIVERKGETEEIIGPAVTPLNKQ